MKGVTNIEDRRIPTVYVNVYIQAAILQRSSSPLLIVDKLKTQTGQSRAGADITPIPNLNLTE